MTFHIGHMCVTSFQPEYVTSLWEMLIGQISSHKGCSFSSCQHLLMHSFSYKYVFESILLITFPFALRSTVLSSKSLQNLNCNYLPRKLATQTFSRRGRAPSSWGQACCKTRTLNSAGEIVITHDQMLEVLKIG